MTDPKEDLEKKTDDEGSTEDAPEVEERALAKPTGAGEKLKLDDAKEDAKEEPGHVPVAVGELRVAAPSQLGYRRFVYAAYFTGAIAVAFLSSKIIGYAWYRLKDWKPLSVIGEPRDEIIYPVAALLGVGAALYYWRRTRARELAEQVASEMSKVTWPGRTEVQNSTVVVIITTLVSTVFFLLMDRFWGFVTDLVYKFSV